MSAMSGDEKLRLRCLELSIESYSMDRFYDNVGRPLIEMHGPAIRGRAALFAEFVMHGTCEEDDEE